MRLEGSLMLPDDDPLRGVTILGVIGTLDRTGGAEKAFRCITDGFRELLRVRVLLVSHVLPNDPVGTDDYHVLRPDGESAGLGMVRRLRRLILDVPRPAILFPFQINVNIVAMMATLSLPRSRRLPIVFNDRASIDFMTRAVPGNGIEDELRTFLFRSFTRFCYRRADRIVCNAERSTEKVRAFIGRASPPVSTIYNPVPTEQIQARFAERDRRTIQSARPLILGHGRLHPKKGWDVLMRAFAQVREHVADARLEIVGEGPERSNLEAVARELGIEDACSMPGFSSDPLGRIDACDIYALPSRWEGLPNSLLEALAVGAPAVAADCDTGPDEIIGTEGERGLLVPVDDVEALSNALLVLLGDADLRSKVARAGRRRALDFTLERSVLSYANLFRELL